MKICVLYGGLSGERDVSLSSGSGVARALRQRGHRVALTDLFLGYESDFENIDAAFTAEGGGCGAVTENIPDIERVKAMRPDSEVLFGPRVMEVCRAADIVFMALHGGDGENGRVQAALDINGVRYTGADYLGSALAMNKQLSKTLFRAAGLDVPQGVIVHRGAPTPQDVGFPCVVKPCSGGSSVGTNIVHSAEDFAAALDEAFKYEDAVLVEKHISARELTVGVIDGKAMPVIEIIPKTGFYDYKNKYQAGATDELCPAPIGEAATAKAQETAERAYSALLLSSYARVDMLWDEQKDIYYVLEANTLPGMTPTSLIPQMAAAQGMDYGELCEELIRVSLKKYDT
ncbi:MAG: D-alanine--D-alanine ligase [Oscillospiraceae bacterium]|nr:D-alanine--D-alanine ligase [Oscillospiraceae bacterium]